ncbi:MAG: hypothetical protein A2W31_07315 [Planctomycetes bacterium RBG_16_64_10]|nr:MAG: hypothetical protein A2W31_07315 [Planctomycetes bacterium RBG_16_64_10]
MHHPRRLNIPGEDLNHVSHYFDEPHPFFRRKLLVVGGRNSAVEAALRCHRAGAQVSISYRGRAFPEQSIKYWLRPDIESQIQHGAIAFYPETVPTRIEPGWVTLQAVHSGAEQQVEADFVLLLIGYQTDQRLFTKLGMVLEGESKAPRVDVATMETSVPGLFVAGTAAAGTQRDFRLFIENCHPHVGRIARALTGTSPLFATDDPSQLVRQLPES